VYAAFSITTGLKAKSATSGKIRGRRSAWRQRGDAGETQERGEAHDQQKQQEAPLGFGKASRPPAGLRFARRFDAFGIRVLPLVARTRAVEQMAPRSQLRLRDGVCSILR
jgi:hypothetical protein